MNIKQSIYTISVWSSLLAAAIGTGCSTPGRSLALGGAIGAGAGAIAGGLADPGKDGKYRTRNVVVGSALGGVAGLATAGLLYDASEDKRREGFEAGKKAGTAPQPGTMPQLSEPKIEARWIDSKVIGNRYVEGHFEYVITETTRWEASR